MTSLGSQRVEEHHRGFRLVNQRTEARQQDIRDERRTVHGNAQAVDEQVCCKRQKTLMIPWALAEYIHNPLAKDTRMLDSCICGFGKQPLPLLPGKQNLYEEAFIDATCKQIKLFGDFDHGGVDNVGTIEIAV
eukprot:TRINITY_DN1432_c0_g4_i1.p2 TRINITY_DN1432_c0_g4~~TRINITY_DN1432_c0_g4_i1.p2  ORF type:complete len:133 (+),score=5.21 TRINITY_DN1432_c0_g4_i1:174-572(+)